MTSKRYFYIMSAVLVLVVGLIIGGTVGGNMILQKKSEKLTQIKIENKAIEMQQTALLQAKKDVERYNEIDKIAKSVVPQDKDQAKTVREIVKIAGESGVPITSVTFQSSTLGNAAPTAPTTEGGTPVAKAAPTISQVKPVDGIPGVFTLEVQVTSAGKVSYQNFIRFLEGLEKNRRTAHVSVINITPAVNRNQLDFTLTLNAYLKP